MALQYAIAVQSLVLFVNSVTILTLRDLTICWCMTFTKAPNPFLPPLPKWLTWPLDVCGVGGYGWFSWGNNFFPKPLELEMFSPTYNSIRFFFQYYTSWVIFFHGRILFFPGISFRAFFLSKSVCRIFFSEITHNRPKKSNSRPLKSTKHLLSWQILICQSFLKSFETTGDRGEGRNSFLLSTTRTVFKDVRRRHNQNFLDG